MEQIILTIESAQQIAEAAIAKIIKTSANLQQYQFNPVKFRRENDSYWVFSAASEQLIEEGFVPGAIFACIDKRDGHIWNDAEHEKYAQQHNALKNIPPHEAVAA